MEGTDKNKVSAVSPVEKVKRAVPDSYARPGKEPPDVLRQTEAKARVDISSSEGTILAVHEGRRAGRRSGSHSRIYELFDDERLPLAERRRNPAHREAWEARRWSSGRTTASPSPRRWGREGLLKARIAPAPQAPAGGEYSQPPGDTPGRIPRLSGQG